MALALLAVAGSGATVTPAPAAAETWTWPVDGEVITRYLNRGGPYAAGQHRGIDVAAEVGRPVVAAVGGQVRFAGLVGSSGITVSVRTADGRFDTSYLHLSTAVVRAGASVGPGEPIGVVGTSGRPSVGRPHLHFGVREAGTRRYRDPLAFLPPAVGVRDGPRGAPLAVRAPIRLAPARRPVARPAPVGAPIGLAPAPRPAMRPAPSPVWRRGGLAAAAPSTAPGPGPHAERGWAIACGALIAAAALLGGAMPAGRSRLRAARRAVVALVRIGA